MIFLKNDSNDDEISQETKDLLDKMLEEGEREIKEGKGLTTEELLAQIKNEKI